MQIGLVERYGYPSEEHHVTTEDGYNLKVHRIPGSPLSNSQQNKIVVFLMHGILCSSDCWAMFGANKDLGKFINKNNAKIILYILEIINVFC